MSLDSPWLGTAAAIIVPALGHLYHFILSVNITSGWGLRETRLSRLRLALMLIFGGSAALLLAGHLKEPWWNWGWPGQSYAWLCLVSGGLVWPLTSLRLGMRRRPRGVAGRFDLLDLEEQLGTENAIGTGKGSWILRLPGNESLQLLRREWVVRHPGLPQALDGLTIVQLSDLHFAPCFRRAFFARVVEACAVWKADLVLITGDLVDADEVIPWIEPVLEPLQARLGKYAILGNHDVEHQPGACWMPSRMRGSHHSKDAGARSKIMERPWPWEEPRPPGDPRSRRPWFHWPISGSC